MQLLLWNLKQEYQETLPQWHSLQQQVGSDTPREALTLSNNPVAQRQDVASDDTSQGAINMEIYHVSRKLGDKTCLGRNNWYHTGSQKLLFVTTGYQYCSWELLI